MLELHRDLIRARTIESDLHEGTVFNLTDSSFETFEKAKALIGFLERRNALKTKLANNRQPSLETVAKHLRDMTPEKVAPLVVYLASDQASFITGVILPVDGGVMAGRQ